MLTKPHNGWTSFSLEGTHTYRLSYLDDIAIEWLETGDIWFGKTVTILC